jgi:cytochrome c
MRAPDHLPVLGLLAGMTLCAACGPEVRDPPAAGNAERGREQMERYGCGACHVIPGIRSARGQVGPPLTGYPRRAYVAGSQPNSPAALAKFLQDPTAARPDTAMPDLAVDAATAEDMAAWLWKAP